MFLAAVLLPGSKTASSENSCKRGPDDSVRLEFLKTHNFHTHGKLAISDATKNTPFETVSDLIEFCSCVSKYTHKLSVHVTELRLTPQTTQQETTVTKPP